MKTCIFCFNEIADSAQKCPKCSRKCGHAFPCKSCSTLLAEKDTFDRSYSAPSGRYYPSTGYIEYVPGGFYAVTIPCRKCGEKRPRAYPWFMWIALPAALFLPIFPAKTFALKIIGGADEAMNVFIAYVFAVIFGYAVYWGTYELLMNIYVRPKESNKLIKLLSNPKAPNQLEKIKSQIATRNARGIVTSIVLALAALLFIVFIVRRLIWAFQIH